MNPLLIHTAASTAATAWQDRLYASATRVSASVPATVVPKPTVLDGSATPPTDVTYGDPSKPVIDPSSDDALAARMQRNAASADSGSLFAGLGQALLGRFATDGADFVSDVASTSAADAAINLGIRTASGATVSLSLSGTQSGLSVSLTSDRTLSDSERTAIASLARGFQDAVDGLGKAPPLLSLDGLMGADTSVLSSVDLHASVATAPGVHEAIALHVGSDARSLKVDGAAGSLALNLDMSQPATWGSRAQRDASVAAYLGKVGAAAIRGHADASLVAMFKDGFTQLNSHYPPMPTSASVRGSVRDLSATDHSVLTGLADFDGSISQATNAPNPMRGDELDTFNYDVSQSTHLSGRNARDRHIDQSQTSHLKASFHESPWPGGHLNLTDKPGSQNYKYTEIDDSATSSTSIAYAKGELISATTSEASSQDTRVRTYMVAQLIDDTDTPSHHDTQRDLLPLLKAQAHDHALSSN